MTDNLANISLELRLNISVQICILESIVAAVLSICISSIEYNRAMLRFQKQQRPRQQRVVALCIFIRHFCNETSRAVTEDRKNKWQTADR